MKPFTRSRFRFHDWLYYSRPPREACGILSHCHSRLARDEPRRLEQAIDAYRFSSCGAIRRRALETIRAAATSPIWRERKIGWKRYQSQLESPGLTRSVVLKAPGEGGEKGVMLLTFEYNWLRLLAGVSDLGRLERDYDIIFSTSSSPTSYQMLALALSSLKGTVFVQSCNYDEIPDMEAIHPRVRCLPMLPCDWIDPSHFVPRPRQERDVDILMVANWDLFKRQWHFFDVLRTMDPGLRVVMIGQPAGPFDIEFARRTARLFGAPQDIEFHQSLEVDEVRDFQCRSKVSTIFSRREGCCVAITESLFADTPVAMLADAHVGPRAYINAETGVLLDRRGPAGRQLQDFLDRTDQFSPRSWAERHISARVSARSLNSFMRKHALAEGRPWTTDLLVPCWRAHPTLRHNPDREKLRPAYDALHAAFPQVFPADLMETSHR